MAILQALLSLLSRTASTILNTIFGWAVVALFGRTSQTEQTLLSALVAVAAAWPLLLLGIAFPKIAAMVIAFVPLSKNVPSWIVRLVWIGLALVVPFVVGLVVAAKAPAGTPPEPVWKRLLRGFPITLALASSFVLMFVTVPALRIVAAVKGRKDSHVPLITTAAEYRAASHQIDRLLDDHGFETRRTDPSWWLTAPSKILLTLGGKAFRGYIPKQLSYWSGPKLELALYPSDLLVRGAEPESTWVRGMIDESFASGPGLQTTDTQAQALEQQLHRLWNVYLDNPDAHAHARILRARLGEILSDLGRAQVPYDDWQVLYRQALQLGRALDAQPQLLQAQHLNAP
jgi:hypothetical protein